MSTGECQAYVYLLERTIDGALLQGVFRAFSELDERTMKYLCIESTIYYNMSWREAPVTHTQRSILSR